jgi:hypothetical protein
LVGVYRVKHAALNPPAQLRPMRDPSGTAPFWYLPVKDLLLGEMKTHHVFVD